MKKDSKEIDFSRLNEVYDLSRSKAVSFSLTYEEASNSWYFSIDSMLQSERYVGRSGSLFIVLEKVVERLKGY